MISNGEKVCDGSWNLQIFVTDLNVECTLIVKGDLHIGGVLLKLVEDLGITKNWSNHALWWPLKNKWLCRTKSTLNQCDVHSTDVLHFTPMHKSIRIQLPDLRILETQVDFSVKTFSAVVQLCKELGIRHPEELSFCKPLELAHLKNNYHDIDKKKSDRNSKMKNGHKVTQQDTNSFSSNSSLNSLGKSNSFLCAPTVPQNKSLTLSTPHTSPYSTCNRTFSPNTSTNYDQVDGAFDTSLASSPPTLNAEARSHLLRPKNLVEKARMNVVWLNSSLSIMEQGVKEYDTLCLRFKFYDFFDLNPKYDAVRINQIYEQARWQLLNEEIGCTEEEMLKFAALQLQVSLQATLPQPDALNGSNSFLNSEDDIDAALADLQVSLEGNDRANMSADITEVPELLDYLKFLKPKKFTWNAFKRYWFTCRDLSLVLFKNKEDAMNHGKPPAYIISLRGCEVTSDTNVSQNKYGIKLKICGSDDMDEFLIRCDTEEQYTKWMAAFTLAAKGKSLADSSYKTEVENISKFLHFHRPAEQPPIINPSTLDIKPEDYVTTKFTKKYNKTKLAQKIVEVHANVKDLSLIDAKLTYINAWISLPEFGISLFIVKFVGSEKDELLGIAHNRIIKMEINSGDHLKTWRLKNLMTWNVKWNDCLVVINFENEEIKFSCSSADCKVIHEFIGGYIFLATRSKDSNQTLNDELFHKLTGGWN